LLAHRIGSRQLLEQEREQVEIYEGQSAGRVKSGEVIVSEPIEEHLREINSLFLMDLSLWFKVRQTRITRMV
jgi:hypothetical protein